MDIKTVSKSTNFSVIIMIIVFLSLPVLMLMTNFNLKNASPSNFIAVQIEGEPKIKKVIVQSRLCIMLSLLNHGLKYQPTTF